MIDIIGMRSAQAIELPLTAEKEAPLSENQTLNQQPLFGKRGEVPSIWIRICLLELSVRNRSSGEYRNQMAELRRKEQGFCPHPRASLCDHRGPSASPHPGKI